MSRLRAVLIDRYADHYARGKASAVPQAMAAPLQRQLELTYGAVLAELPRGSRVLDLGCGTGYLLSWLNGHPHINVTGVDSSTSQIAIVREALPALEVRCEEALSYLRRHRGRFEAIFCLDVLEHIPDDQLLELTEAAGAALVPGGCLVTKVPNAANLTGGQLRYIDLTHERSFTQLSLLQLYNAAGLCECRVVPLRAGDWRGRVRLLCERALHRTLFRICGDAREQVFTRTISMIGYAR